MADAAGARFRLARHPDLRILRFEDESLVFNPVLWHTHFLNAACTLIVDCLSEEAASADELSIGLCDEAGNRLLPREQIEQVLRELEGLGLVARAENGPPE